MKFAVFALIGGASALDLKFNDWTGERIEDKQRAMDRAWDEMMDPRMDYDQMMRHHEANFKHIFGESMEDMMVRMKPEERYVPQAVGFWNSPELATMWDWEMDFLRNDPKFRKIVHEYQKLNQDVFGGCGRRGCKRGLLDDAEFERVRPEDDNMSRSQREKNTWNMIHYDNNDIKDVFEDAEDMLNDYAEMAYDFEYEPFQEALKLHYKVRTQKDWLEMQHNFQDDFNIRSIQDYHDAEDRFFGRLIEAAETWPQVVAMRKAKERFVREIGSGVEISDLPEGERMQWVNQFFNDVTNMLKSGRPAEQLHDAFLDMFDDFYREWQAYNTKIYWMEEELGKDTA